MCKILLYPVTILSIFDMEFYPLICSVLSSLTLYYIWGNYHNISRFTHVHVSAINYIFSSRLFNKLSSDHHIEFKLIDKIS